MQVLVQAPPAARSLGQKLYLGVATLILIGIVIEGFLIGPSLFATTRWGRAVHGDLGAVVFLLTLLLPVTGRLSRLPGKVIFLSALLFVLALLEVASASLGRSTPFLAAFHPANALLMVGLTVVLLIQAWQVTRGGAG